ncbi:hypothetical protein ACFU7T_38510, partial [Streptomyces sp. NPDC057555]|uniref:hypothetical protein n=1 Tax=Streptomyces sp. NPDC057555 TaxID=3346166 RepID=UPI0036B609E7
RTLPSATLSGFLRALPFGLASPTLSDPFGPDFRRCDPAFRHSRGSNRTRSVSVSGPLLERGSAASLSLFSLSDCIRSSFVSGRSAAGANFALNYPSEGLVFRLSPLYQKMIDPNDRAELLV